MMICPKCGFEQPDGPECLRCGIIFSRYKGPVLGESPRPAAVPPPPLPLSDSLAAAPVSASPPYAPPAPAMAAAAGGTQYGGPVPAVAGGGTLYEGPAPGSPAASLATQPVHRGELEVGKVLAETFSIYFRNFVPFLLLTGVALSPLILSLVLIGTGSVTEMGLGMAIGSVVLVVLSFVFCPQLATASITYGVFQQMRGHDVSIADCLGRGLSSLLPVMGLVIIQGLGVLAGFIACIVPGIILYLRWSVSVPAAVEERPGAFEALRRSTFLTDGHKGAIFGVLFVVNFLSNGIQRGLELATPDDPSALLMGIGAVSFLSVGIAATATAVMYYRLRSIKESIDVDQIASVFD